MLKNKIDLETAKKLYVYIKPFRAYLYISLVFSLISVFCSLYSTVLIGQAIDCIVAKDSVNFSKLTKLIIGIAVLIGALFTAEYLQSVFTQKLSYKTINRIRTECIIRLEKTPIAYIDSHDKGDILSRIITDVTEISDGLLLGFTQLFNGIITILATFVIMFILNYQIALVVVLITPLSLFVASYIAKTSASQFKEQAEKRGELTGLIDEMIGNQKVVKAYSQEENIEKRFEKINQELKVCGTKATFFSALTNPTTRVINNIVFAAVGIIGALSVIANPVAFGVGALSSFLIYAGKYSKPFNEISGVVTELQSAYTSAKRVFEVIEADMEIPDSENAVVLQNVVGKIELKDVEFSYNKEEKLIENLNLKVKPGQKIAIVGETGCGKTTIINLLMRFYDVDKGYINVDGVNIKDATRNSLRLNYGMVLQDTWLKKGTVAENIAYGSPKANMEDIITAAKNARADSFIRRLPNGYETQIGEESGNISEGQKQLLCIARIMLSPPPMLILDEATSSIDTRTEIKIQKAFDAMTKGRTSFIVAHRLSTIRSADKILVMRKGEIVEQGNHKELIEKRGYYYDLYNSQFSIV